MVEIKIVHLGKQTKTIHFGSPVTLGEVMNAADETFIQGNVTVNNHEVTRDTILYDGTTVYVGEPVKGNLPVNVQLICLGKNTLEVAVQENSTIKSAIDSLDPESRERFYNGAGQPVYEFRSTSGTILDINSVIPDPVNGNSRIICSQKMKGNTCTEC